MTTEKTDNQKQRETSPQRSLPKESKRHAAIARWLRRDSPGMPPVRGNTWFH